MISTTRIKTQSVSFYPFEQTTHLQPQRLRTKDFVHPSLRSPYHLSLLSHNHRLNEYGINLKSLEDIHPNKTSQGWSLSNINHTSQYTKGDKNYSDNSLNKAVGLRKTDTLSKKKAHQNRGALRKMIGAIFHLNRTSTPKLSQHTLDLNQCSTRVHPGTNNQFKNFSQLIDSTGKRLCKSQTGRANTHIIGHRGNEYVLLNSLTSSQVEQLNDLLDQCEPEIEEFRNNRLKVIIGSGAFGNVRLALNKNTNSLVVVKKMLPEFGFEEIKKFQMLENLPQQARKSIINLEDYAIVPGKNGRLKAYLFEEFMTSGDLGNYENAAILDMPKTHREKIELALHILELVQNIHRFHTYHRDLKPDNLLRAQDGSLKLGDVGFMSQDLHPDEAGGTIPFMPPEAKQPDARADLADAFALGIMFYQLLGKTHPSEDYPPTNPAKDNQAQSNEYLLQHPIFNRYCDYFSKVNNTQHFSLESIAFQLMHPVADKRLTVSQALFLVSKLLEKETQ